MLSSSAENNGAISRNSVGSGGSTAEVILGLGGMQEGECGWPMWLLCSGSWPDSYVLSGYGYFRWSLKLTVFFPSAVTMSLRPYIVAVEAERLNLRTSKPG